MSLGLSPFRRYYITDKEYNDDNSSLYKQTWNNLWHGMDTFFGDARYTDDDGDTMYEFEVPGFNKDNLNITISDGMLTISGTRETKNKSHAGTREIYKRLSLGVSSPDIDAEIKDGILYLTFNNPESERKQIELK